jgi:hypothetical protein
VTLLQPSSQRWSSIERSESSHVIPKNVGPPARSQPHHACAGGFNMDLKCGIYTT